MPTRQFIFERFARDLAYPLDQEVLVGGHYRSAVQHGDLVHISGQLPRVGTEVKWPGCVGETVTLDEAREAARICTMRALHVLQRQLGSLERVAQILQMNVYVHCTADFTRQSEVADAASDLLHAVLGDSGMHTRTSVGVCQLPKNAPVELNLMAAAHPPARQAP